MKEEILKAIKLSNKPLKVGDLEKITGFSRNDIQKALNELAIEGKIQMDKCYNKVLGIKEEHNGK